MPCIRLAPLLGSVRLRPERRDQSAERIRFTEESLTVRASHTQVERDKRPTVAQGVASAERPQPAIGDVADFANRGSGAVPFKHRKISRHEGTPVRGVSR
jgi:hypothetical protein